MNHCYKTPYQILLVWYTRFLRGMCRLCPPLPSKATLFYFTQLCEIQLGTIAQRLSFQHLHTHIQNKTHNYLEVILTVFNHLILGCSGQDRLDTIFIPLTPHSQWFHEMKGTKACLESQNLLSKAAVTNSWRFGVHHCPFISVSLLPGPSQQTAFCPHAVSAPVTLRCRRTRSSQMIHCCLLSCVCDSDPVLHLLKTPQWFYIILRHGCQGPRGSNQPWLSFQLCFLFQTFFVANPLRSNQPSWQSSNPLTFLHLRAFALAVPSAWSIIFPLIASDWLPHSGFAQISSLFNHPI